jgi:hypothetical protein
VLRLVAHHAHEMPAAYSVLPLSGTAARADDGDDGDNGDNGDNGEE